MPPQIMQPVRSMRRAFTLIEILIVVAVVAILISLLMPAIQSSRESARLLQCKRNLAQIALGCSQHMSSQQYLPNPGGWYEHTGDPDQGLGAAQRGGWLYSVLPFIDMNELYSMGMGLPTADKNAARNERIRTIVPNYVCPTRGEPQVRLQGGGFFGQTTIVRSDYGGCRAGTSAGVLSRMTRDYEVTDGFSNVFLCGERYINPDMYTGQYNSNDQGWTVGADQDTLCRISAYSDGSGFLNIWEPRQDTRGLSSFIVGGVNAAPNGIAFGSPHASLPMAMCDGSVRGFNWGFDLPLFQRLGGMADGGSVDELK